MSDQLEAMLDRLDAGPGATDPAPAFLRAVARRRHRRRVARVGSAAAVLLAAAGVWMVVRGVAPVAPRVRNLTDGAGPAPAVMQVRSLAALTRANVGRDDGDLSLPDTAGSGGAEPVRLGLRLDSERLERWLGQ